MKPKTRTQGLQFLGTGGLFLAANVVLSLTTGYFSPTLVILGVMGVGTGASLALWGDALSKMPASQKAPAVLISLTVVGLIAVGIARLLGVRT